MYLIQKWLKAAKARRKDYLVEQKNVEQKFGYGYHLVIWESKLLDTFDAQ